MSAIQIPVCIALGYPSPFTTYFSPYPANTAGYQYSATFCAFRTYIDVGHVTTNVIMIGILP